MKDRYMFASSLQNTKYKITILSGGFFLFRKESFKLEISWKMQNINSTSHWLDPFQWSHVSWKNGNVSRKKHCK
jgi:hypothetical protein